MVTKRQHQNIAVRLACLPDNLADARLSHNLTQQELADSTGIHPAAISHYEMGTRTPNLRNLLTLAAALDTTLNDLVE